MRAIRDRSINAFAIAFLATMIGCAPYPEPVASQAAPPAVLPEFQRVMVPGLDSFVAHGTAWVPVSRNGHIAFLDRSDPTSRSITIIDTLGKVVRTSVDLKPMPPSMTPMFFLHTEDDLFMLNLETKRLERFGVDGTHKGTSAAFDAGMPIGVVADSVDMVIFATEGMMFESINRVSLKTFQSRTVIDATDSTFASFRGPIASNNRGTVLAQGGAYWLQSYSRDGRRVARWGRDLPPRLTTRDQPDNRHFYNIVFDGAGRLLAIGRDTNGVFFADVFADTTFVGRAPLPCQGLGPVFNGHWMALNCSVSKDSKQTELQLYRVVK